MRITLIVACMLGAVALGRKNLALKKEAKKALMNKRRAARTMQEDDYLKNMPEQPWNCFDEASYNYESGTECDGIWEAWDIYCVWEVWAFEECNAVEEAFGK